MAKPTTTRHLYEIHTSPQAPFVGALVSAENVAELAQLRDFVVRAAAALAPPVAEIRYRHLDLLRMRILRWAYLRASGDGSKAASVG